MEKIKRKIHKSTVAVIGGAGFIGSHLVNYLIDKRECKVIVIDNLISGQKRFVHPDAIFEYADITGSEEHLLRLFKHYEVEFVFNYAAEPYIPVSFKRPVHVFNINAFGALKVINAAQEAGVEGILQVSSAEIYGSSGFNNASKIDENYPVVPHSTYGAAKAAIDAMVQVSWRERQAPVLSLRQFNCVGERETHPYIIPEIIQQVHAAIKEQRHLSNEGVVVELGNNSFRDFQYAGDAALLAVELLECGEFGEVYNMGSEEGILMYDLAVVIGRLMGVEVKVKQDPARHRPWEIWHLQSDNTKLYNEIGGKPVHLVGFMAGLQRTIEWFESNGHKWDF
jgi:nucleoside-diphosphate-sugar epimerase